MQKHAEIYHKEIAGRRIQRLKNVTIRRPIYCVSNDSDEYDSQMTVNVCVLGCVVCTSLVCKSKWILYLHYLASCVSFIYTVEQVSVEG